MIGKPGAKTPYAACDGCGKHAPTATLWEHGSNMLCLDCRCVRTAIEEEGGEEGGTSDQLPPLTPPSPEPGSAEMDELLAEADRERLVNFVRACANDANWSTQNQAGDLVVWTPYPPLHVTARRLLEEIEK
jgi:hypothetical protein